jgi:hypothetical protein
MSRTTLPPDPAELPPPPTQPVIIRLADVAPAPVQWLWPDRIPLDISTDAALGRHDPREDQIDAREWLQDALASGPLRAKDILDEAELVGYSQRTIRHAFRQIHALRRRKGSHSFAARIWALPQHKDQLDDFIP